jgi:predicted DNA-binding ribbon-helix-helix protein
MILGKNKLGYSTINQKRSVLLSGHRTSISLELAFWLKLKEICEQQGKSINQQITEIDNTRLNKPNKNLSSAIRVFVLEQTSQN